MKKIALLFFLMVIAYAQSDSIYATIEADTVTIWHTGSNRNCGSLFELQVSVEDHSITVTEVDTATMWTTCECLFDLSVSITGLAPGVYNADIFATDTFSVSYPHYRGSTSFTIDSISVQNQNISDCTISREDSSYIDVAVQGESLYLFWSTPLLNCCLEPAWDGWLAGDTFHVAMTDTGPPCDCICPFELDVTFGPFAPGTYVLDFMDGQYGYPGFTVSGVLRDVIVIRSEQSGCYHASGTGVDILPGSYILLNAYPNPFNPSTRIVYYIPERSAVTISIYDLLGREVASLVNSVVREGVNSTAWDGSVSGGELAGSGVYLCRMQAGKHSITRKLVLLR